MKIVYIAHPISGDVQGNIERIVKIIERINVMEPGIVPFAPYLGDCMAVRDDDPEMRRRGIQNNHELILRGFIDEIWLFGDKISKGMWDEAYLAFHNGIAVIPKTEETNKEWVTKMGFISITL